ncbi:inactive hydroxysteroid dehydrogenase-like protein 1 isoform X1 [Lineus longissimus]|uniref:inactive hydroxysteroid dehydrogenase-like protein 1 isoform X1 n=1 Tax=Lineus longissimus TaxID=88925 RepID=UPI00315DAC9A
MTSVDDLNFLFISRQISEIFTSYRDSFALIGLVYATRKTQSVVCSLLDAVRTHIWSKYGRLDLVKKYGKWAVVTGCAEGIGKQFVIEFAEQGMNVVMLSRGSHGNLEKTAEEIASRFGVSVHPVIVDFNSGPEIYKMIEKELEGKDIGILVNNVGVMYSYPQYFLDVPEERLWQLINVNVAAATMMTHLVLPQMEKKKRGAIINLSSGSCHKPTPQMTVYTATKVYLDHFSRALHYEYKDKGITVQCLMPFYVATRMTSYSKSLSNPSLLIPSASAYARNALRTLGYSTRTSGYWPHTIQSWIANLVPEPLWMWAASRLNTALRRQAQQRVRHRSGRRSHQSMTSSSSASSLSESPSNPNLNVPSS